MMQWVRDALVDAAMSLLTDSPGAQVHLYKDDVLLTPDIEGSAMDSDHQADFDGYDAKTGLTDWGTYFDPDSGRRIIQKSVAIAWIAGAAITPQTIYGWYLWDKDSDLFLVQRFAQPVTMAKEGDRLAFYPTVYFPDSMGE